MSAAAKLCHDTDKQNISFINVDKSTQKSSSQDVSSKAIDLTGPVFDNAVTNPSQDESAFDVLLDNTDADDADDALVISTDVLDQSLAIDVIDMVVELAASIDIPSDVLKRTIHKGLQIQKRQELCRSFKPCTYLVRSYSELNSAGHEVKFNQDTGLINCPCKHALATSVCAHAIAVAKDLGMEKLYAMYLKKSKAVSLTHVASVNVPRNNGKKTPSKARSRPLSPSNRTALTPHAPGPSTSSLNVSPNISILIPQPLRQITLNNPPPAVTGHTPVGQRMPPTPLPPPTNNPYEVILRTSRIKSGCSCDKPKQGTLHKERFVIRRSERKYYPHRNDDGSRSYHLSQKHENKHYHIRLNCLTDQNPDFNVAQLAPITVQVDDELLALLTSIGVQVTIQ